MGMNPDPLCYVLRNNPLRVVRASLITGDNTELVLPPRPKNLPLSPTAVTLEIITAHLPYLSLERLSATPDDQLLFFWTEVSTFTVADIHTVKGMTTSWVGYRYHIYPKMGHSGHDSGSDLDPGLATDKPNIVGSTDHLIPSDPEDGALVHGEGDFDFVLLATNRPITGEPPEKIVLQVVWEDGIAYRVCIATIVEDAWKKAEPQMRLVVLG